MSRNYLQILCNIGQAAIQLLPFSIALSPFLLQTCMQKVIQMIELYMATAYKMEYFAAPEILNNLKRRQTRKFNCGSHPFHHWRRSVMVRARDFQVRGHGFESHTGFSCIAVTNADISIGKQFWPHCSVQIVRKMDIFMNYVLYNNN